MSKYGHEHEALCIAGQVAGGLVASLEQDHGLTVSDEMRARLHNGLRIMLTVEIARCLEQEVGR